MKAKQNNNNAKCAQIPTVIYNSVINEPSQMEMWNEHQQQQQQQQQNREIGNSGAKT
jgi:hypothetical protein